MPTTPRLAALLILLCACGDASSERSPREASEEAPQGVIHLDPRLPDGRSPARAIQDAETVLDLAPDADWTARGGRVLALPEGGFRLAPPAGGAPRAAPAWLELDQALSADDWDGFEVDCRVTARTLLRVAWSNDGRPHGVDVPVQISADATTARFELAPHPAWRGDVTDVRVGLELDPTKPFEIFATRFTAGGLSVGLEPLEGDTGGDMGLVALGFDCRRAWPAHDDVELIASADVPAGGALSLAVAPGEPLLGTGAVATFRVSARRPGEAWAQVGERALPAAASVEEATWSDWLLPLDAYAGGPVELRFTGSVEGGPPRIPGHPTARLLWAVPEVLGHRPDDALPNLVLVTMDTTRSDAVGGTGWTPRLDELAARGLLFENAWSAAESTTPSHASLMTGLQVQEHGALGNRFALPADAATLAEALRARGYHTMAAVSARHLQAGNGFGQGFDVFHLARREALTDGRYALAALQERLQAQGDAPARPVFVWLHLFDPHTPYRVPDAFRDAFLAERGLTPPPDRVEPPTVPEFDRYPGGLTWMDGMNSLERVRFEYQLGVAFADRLVGEFLDALDEAGERERTAVVVTSDHGEAMGEREQWFNHVGLFPEVLHVPLILALPPGDARMGEPGRRVATAVSAIDVAPTLLELAGVPVPERMRGRSLLDSAARPDASRRIWFQHSNLAQAGFRDDRVHFVETFTDDVAFVRGSEPDERGRRVPVWRQVDPGERFLFEPSAVLENRAGSDPRADDMARYLTEWMSILGREDSEAVSLSAEDEELLRSLGYAGDDRGH